MNVKKIPISAHQTKPRPIKFKKLQYSSKRLSFFYAVDIILFIINAFHSPRDFICVPASHNIRNHAHVARSTTTPVSSTHTYLPTHRREKNLIRRESRERAGANSNVIQTIDRNSITH